MIFLSCPLNKKWFPGALKKTCKIENRMWRAKQEGVKDVNWTILQLKSMTGTGKLTKPGNRRGEIGVGVELGSSNRGQTGQRWVITWESMCGGEQKTGCSTSVLASLHRFLPKDLFLFSLWLWVATLVWNLLGRS